jgi:hypothetical protein
MDLLNSYFIHIFSYSPRLINQIRATSEEFSKSLENVYMAGIIFTEGSRKTYDMAFVATVLYCIDLANIPKDQLFEPKV